MILKARNTDVPLLIFRSVFDELNILAVEPKTKIKSNTFHPSFKYRTGPNATNLIISSKLKTAV